MNRQKLTSIKIPNNKEFLLPVLSYIDTLAGRHARLDVSRYQQVRFIAGEMIKRRIEKAYPGEVGEIEIELFISEGFFEISVKDKGVPAWADFSFEKKEIVENQNDLLNFIIDLFVDDIGMEKLGNEGQRVYVRKKMINPVEFTKPEPYEETVALDTNITIRPVTTEEDVIEAIRCIYSEYGYSYSYERLYYVKSFMELIKSKEIMSFLAVNDHGQTAGHFVLAFSDLYKNMPEISTVVVKKEFRGLGLFAKFMDYCEKVGKELGLRALMGQPVTFHPMSQKAFLRAEFTATSLLMSYLGRDVESEYNKGEERLGLSVGVKILDENAYSKIYVPNELFAFADKIYKRLGIKYDICQSDAIDDSTEVSVESNAPLKMSKFIIRKAGNDLEQSLSMALKAATRHKSEMIELVIQLNSPSCEHAYNIAKKYDFMFSGFIPGAENGDYLIMQLLCGDEMNYDELVVVGEFEEIKNDVVEIVGYKRSEV